MLYMSASLCLSCHPHWKLVCCTPSVIMSQLCFSGLWGLTGYAGLYHTEHAPPPHDCKIQSISNLPSIWLAIHLATSWNYVISWNLWYTHQDNLIMLFIKVPMLQVALSNSVWLQNDESVHILGKCLRSLGRLIIHCFEEVAMVVSCSYS